MAPQNIQVTPLTASQLEVTWDPPPPESQNGNIQGYKASCHSWLGSSSNSLCARGPEGFGRPLAARWTAVSPQHMHSMDAGPSAWSRLGGDSIGEKGCSEKSHTGSGQLCAQPQNTRACWFCQRNLTSSGAFADNNTSVVSSQRPVTNPNTVSCT